jgi:hypothetical protein
MKPGSISSKTLDQIYIKKKVDLAKVTPSLMRVRLSVKNYNTLIPLKVLGSAKLTTLNLYGLLQY